MELIERYKQMFAKIGSPFQAKGERKYEMNNEKKELVIYEEIGFWGTTAEMVKRDLSDTTGDITVRINSPGGDVFDGMAIYNLLKQYKGKVTTFVDGEAASAAGIIFLAGDERKAPEPSILMLHEAWGVMMGNKRDAKDFARILGEVDGQLLSVLYSLSKKSKEKTKKGFEDEMWLSPESAMDWGFVTEIITYKDDETYDSRPGFDLSAFEDFYGAMFDTTENSDKLSRKAVEQALRNAGLSRNQAKAFYSKGKSIFNGDPDDEDWVELQRLKFKLKKGK